MRNTSSEKAGRRTLTTEQRAGKAPDMVIPLQVTAASRLRIEQLDGGGLSVASEPGAQSKATLRAISDGILLTQPSPISGYSRLSISMPHFLDFVTKPWWERWRESGFLPFRLVFENVENRYLNKSFSVSERGKESQITPLPSADLCYRVKGGTLLGYSSLYPQGVVIRAYYQESTTGLQFQMPVLELVNALLTESEPEPEDAPFLSSLSAFTASEFPRPPLRTHQRVVWEANREMRIHTDRWTDGGALGPDVLHNQFSAKGRKFNNGTYSGYSKCNIYVADLMLKSGFRAPVHPVGINAWHYLSANAFSIAADTTRSYSRVPVFGNPKTLRPWCFNVDNWLREVKGHIRDELRRAQQEQGRCFILIATRRRAFLNLASTCGGVSDALCRCQIAALGHIVIVKDILEEPKLGSEGGRSPLREVHVETLEASLPGPLTRKTLFRAGADDADQDLPDGVRLRTGFLEIRLIEACPGGDPGTIWGLTDLNVITRNDRFRCTKDETAAPRRLSHNPDGSLRSDNAWCVDLWPQKDSSRVEHRKIEEGQNSNG